VPVALVTGANRGIGREVAHQLAEKGFEVVVSARDEANTREAAEEIGGRPLQLDVTEPGSIERAAEALREDPGSLDVLVNNAGVGIDFNVSGLDPDFEAIERTLGTNLLGAYRVTVAMLPLLRASKHPRIVNVSSGMGAVSDMGGYAPGYRFSKAGLNALTRILANELEGEGVLVNSACPGFVKTRMAGRWATKPVEDGAAGIVWLATLPDDGPTGGFFRDGEPIRF
jgi:NAD(P)-dependent dehydrogenase (short-subunit alcohol dehydrogenase family)